MKKCCYFKSTGTWGFGLICVLAQPSYSDKIYDLTFFSKSDRINLGSGLTLTAALSTVAPHTGLWIPSRFNTKSIPWVCQQHSSYFFFFFFFRRGVALFDSVNGCYFRNSERKLLSTEDKGSPVQFQNTRAEKLSEGLFPQLYSV